MASFKQVTLKDPKTGDYLSPRVYGAIEYEVKDDNIEPPYDELGKDAETLQGHPADDFVLDTELTAALAGKADVNHNHDGVYAPASHTHEIGQITGLQGQLDGKAASSHTHAAGQVTAGTFAGNVVAAANGNLGTKMVRNIYAGTSDIGAGSALAMGDIYLVYE